MQIITGAFIATPAYGGLVYVSYMNSVLSAMSLMAQSGVPVQPFMLGNESLITRARMLCVADFMASGYSHLIFIDADITFPPETIMRLMAHDVGIVCASYPLKGYPIEHVVRADSNQLKKKSALGEYLVPLKEAGTGMMCIKREVIERMIKKYPQLKCSVAESRLNQYPEELREQVSQFYYALFDTMLVDADENGEHIYLSEDYAFCRRWRDMGQKIYLDPMIPLSHTGTHTFVSDPEQLNQILRNNHEQS